MTGRLLAVAAIADQWNCSKDYVYDLINAGELPVVQLGRGDRNKYRVREEDVTAYVERNTKIVRKSA